MLTTSQLATLRADIIADGTLNAQPNNSDGNSVIAAAYNLNAVPDFWVWRTSVPKSEMTNSVSVDATTFSWTGTGFITRSVGERDAWRELFGEGGVCNPSLANVRQAFSDIFSGATAPAPANRTHLTTVARRKATRGEKLFATGTGSTASPGLLNVVAAGAIGFSEGQLTYSDVGQARSN